MFDFQSKSTRRRYRPELQVLEDRTVPASFIAVGSDGPVGDPNLGAGAGEMRMFGDLNADGNYVLTDLIQPYGPIIVGVRTAMGDFDGDGNDELVTAPTAAFGAGPHIKTFDVTSEGKVGAIQDNFFAFLGTNATGPGLYIATGDLDGDGRDELAVAMGGSVNGISNGAQVEIYDDTNLDGRLTLVDSFTAFTTGPASVAGVTLAIGDVLPGVGAEELIYATATGIPMGNNLGVFIPGGGSAVFIRSDLDADDLDPFDGTVTTTASISDDPVQDSILAFGGFAGGVYVAASDVGATGFDSLVVGTGPGAASVQTYRDTDMDGAVSDDAIATQTPFGGGFTGGVRVSGDSVDLYDDPDGTFMFEDHHLDFLFATGPGADLIQTQNGSNTQFDPAFTPSTFGPPKLTGSNIAWGEIRLESFAANIHFPTLDNPRIGGLIVDNAERRFENFVPAGAGQIRDLDVSVNIAHGFGADLDVFLMGPNGVEIRLWNDENGASDDFIVRLDDEAATAIEVAAADSALNGTFRPDEALTAFDGIDASGLWTLRIVDDAAGISGQLFSWTLHISYIDDTTAPLIP